MMPKHSRFNKKFENTRMISAGPLSAGAVPVGQESRRNIRAHSISPVSDLVSKLRRVDSENRPKREPGVAGAKALNGVPVEDVDDEDDEEGTDKDGDLKINMGKQLKFSAEDVALFPVRATREKHHEFGEDSKPDKTIKTEFHNESSDLSSRESSATPAVASGTSSSDASREGTAPPQENGEVVDAIAEYQKKQERQKLRADYSTIVRYMEDMSVEEGDDNKSAKLLNKEEAKKVKVEPDTEMDEKKDEKDEDKKPETSKPNKYLLIQLPAVLPPMEKSESGIKVKPEPGTKDSKVKSEEKEDLTTSLPKGIIGKLQYHKSGRVTMKIGSSVFELSGGTPSTFAQEVMAVRPSSKECYHLGSVSQTVIVTPKMK